MDWYQITKRINGRLYLYWQKTYRVGGSVKTLNKYIGPANNPPPAKSMRATIDALPDWHRDLRDRFDDGQITKMDYLELISKGPHVHKFAWQPAPDEEGNTYEMCECGAVGRVEPLSNTDDLSDTSYFQDPQWHEEYGMGGSPEAEAMLANNNAFTAETLTPAERREDERIQYGTRAARIREQKVAVKKAKRKSRGTAATNPFLGQHLKD